MSKTIQAPSNSYNLPNLYDTDRKAYHIVALHTLARRAAEMESGGLRYCSEGADGRLNIDSTAKMIRIAHIEIEMHKRSLALLN